MIRIMHEDASRETEELDGLVREGKVTAEEAAEGVKKLSGREAHIGKLFRDLMDSLQDEPEEE